MEAKSKFKVFWEQFINGLVKFTTLSSRHGVEITKEVYHPRGSGHDENTQKDFEIIALGIEKRGKC